MVAWQLCHSPQSEDLGFEVWKKVRKKLNLRTIVLGEKVVTLCLLLLFGGNQRERERERERNVFGVQTVKRPWV